MLHYSNQELASAHHVSVRTVRNWIDSARDGKLDLALYEVGQRTYIANTSKNTATIKELVTKGKKYRPHRSQRTVAPQPEFYKLYTQQQLYDLVSNLEVYHELPMQYNYFGDGATNWDKYAQHMAEEEDRNNLTATIELFDLNKQYIDEMLSGFQQINIIDVGVGNALPLRNFVSRLIEKGKMGRYIGIDISPQMLDIAEANVRKWFGDKIIFEKHVLDVDHDRFGYLLAEEYIKSDSEHTSNLLFFLGATLQNFSKPERILEVLHDSMGVRDFLFVELKLDTSSSRRFFDFNPKPASTTLAPIFREIFDLLNIDDTYYEVEMGFDPDLSERFIRVRLKMALSIRFQFEGGERVLNFDKGDSIQLVRFRHYTLNELNEKLVRTGLYPLQSSHTEDKQFVLSMSRIHRD